MDQSTGVFLVILQIITAATADMTCADFKRTLFNEDVSSFLGMSFIVLVDEPKTAFFWENVCIKQHSAQFSVTSSSNGIEENDKTHYINSITVTKESGVDLGTIIFTFSEQVTLASSRGIPFYFNEDNLLPLESLGTEYFIVLPKVNASEYLVRISSIRNDTHTTTTISRSDGEPSDGIIRKHIDKHETFTLRLQFDFTGSRILATYTVAVFYSVMVQSDSLTVLKNLQLPPAAVFGNIYYIVDYMTIAISRRSSSTLRLTAVHDHTTVISSHDDKFEINRGKSQFLKKNSSPIYKLTSEKRFIVSNTHIINDQIILDFVASTDQYFKSSFITQYGQQNAEFIYSSVSGQPIDINVTVSRRHPWGLIYVPYTLQNISSDSHVTIWRITIEYTLPTAFYIYMQSDDPLDGIYKFSGRYLTKAWALYKSLKECRLTRVPVDSCMGTCNYTLEDSCDTHIHKEKTETPKDIVTVSVIVAVAILLGLSVATGRRVYMKIRLKKRVAPNVQSESHEI